jgi:hemerythrin-like domain-containing protein
MNYEYPPSSVPEPYRGIDGDRMKRSPELRLLSVDHHHGLVAARWLRWAESGKEPLDAAIDAFRHAWVDEIEPHFRQEEELVLPAFAAAVGADDPRIGRVLDEHRAIRQAATALPLLEPEAQREAAGALGRLLDDHIRFEERVLFPAVESTLSAAALTALATALDHAKSGEPPSVE